MIIAIGNTYGLNVKSSKLFFNDLRPLFDDSRLLFKKLNTIMQIITIIKRVIIVNQSVKRLKCKP